jgi:hypothetical protein
MITVSYFYHHVEVCMSAGHPENAASWIERELGEIDDNYGFGSIDPSTIVLLGDKCVQFELYANTQANTNGAGI